MNIEKNEALYENGTLKDEYRYGEARLAPIEEKHIVVCVRGSNIHKAAPFLDDFMSELDTASLRGWKVVVFAWTGYLKKWKIKNPHINYHDHNSAEKPVLLARSSRVIVVGFLPNYFCRREGQTVVQLWAEPSGLSPNRNTMAKGFLSQLLNATHIVVQDESQANRVLVDYKMENVYAGHLLVWTRGESFAAGVVANILTVNDLDNPSTWQGFGVKSNTFGKPRILICCRLNDNLGYAAFAQRLACSIDTMRYDVTVLLNRHPWSDEDKAFLNRYPDNIRLISRVGTLPFDVESYERIQFALKQIEESEDYRDWASSIDHDLIQQEARRLVGDSEFDQLLFCDVATPLWYLLIDAIPISKRVKIELVRFTGKDQEDARWHPIPFRLEAQADELLFDKVYLNDKSKISGAESSYSEIAFGFADLPIDAECLGTDIEYVDDAIIGDQRFVFIGKPEKGIRKSGSFLPYPDSSKTNYLVEVSDNKLEQVIDAIAKVSSDKEWNCVVLGQIKSGTRAIIETLYPQRVEFAGKTQYLGVCCGTLTKYISLFDACVADQPATTRQLSFAARYTGKRLLVWSDGYLELDSVCSVKNQDYFIETAHEHAEAFMV